MIGPRFWCFSHFSRSSPHPGHRVDGLSSALWPDTLHPCCCWRWLKDLHLKSSQSSLISLSLRLWNTCSRLHHLILLPSVRVFWFVNVPKLLQDKPDLDLSGTNKALRCSKAQTRIARESPTWAVWTLWSWNSQFLAVFEWQMDSSRISHYSCRFKARKYPAEACWGYDRDARLCPEHHLVPSILHEITDFPKIHMTWYAYYAIMIYHVMTMSRILLILTNPQTISNQYFVVYVHRCS